MAKLPLKELKGNSNAKQFQITVFWKIKSARTLKYAMRTLNIKLLLYDSTSQMTYRTTVFIWLMVGPILLPKQLLLISYDIQISRRVLNTTWELHSK